MENTESKSVIKVGVSQLGNPTPPWMSKSANAIIFICAAWGLFSMGISSIPPDIKAHINEWVLVVSGAIKLGTKFFGYTIQEPT